MSEVVIPGSKAAEVGVDTNPSVPESGDYPDQLPPAEPFYMNRYDQSPDVDVDEPDDDPL